MMSDYDEKLALKFGRALISSHDYQRAILHFEATLANTQCSIDIKAELAELYLQFEEYGKVKYHLWDLNHTRDAQILLDHVCVYLGKRIIVRIHSKK